MLNKTKYHYIQSFLLFTGMISAVSLNGQLNKLSFSFDISPALAKMSNELIDAEYKMSFNVTIRMEIEFPGFINPTIGFNYLNSGEAFHQDLMGQLDINTVKLVHHNNYLVIPVGVKFTKSKYYILPEIGIGMNIANRTRLITTFIDGEVIKETFDQRLNGGKFSKIIIPLYLTLAREINMGKLQIIVGLKSYYGISRVVLEAPRKTHHYGLGILVGVKLA